MAEAITFYTHPFSRGRIARWMLEEVGVAYETVLLDYETSMKARDCLAVNPMGKVPAIRHGDQTVTEAAAICAYMAFAFPDADLAPRDNERGAFFRWLFFAAGPLEQAIFDHAFGVARPEETRRMIGYGSYDAAVDALAQVVSASDFIAGDRFTAADVYVGASIGWALQQGTIEPSPAFDAYAARTADREAWARSNAKDDAAAAEMGLVAPGSS